MQNLWDSACEQLRKEVGEYDFRNWISKAKLASIDGATAVFEVPTQFTGEWILQTYGDRILESIRHLDSSVHRINYIISANPEDTNDHNNVKNENSADAESSLHRFSLNSRFTFDQFVVGKSNEVAYQAARRVAEDAHVNFSPLFFYGGVGLGKTHLMNAVGWSLRQDNPDAKIIYLSAEQFMYLFVRALRTKNTLEFKEMFRSVEVLMVDDIQFIAGKDSTQEEFFYTFNALASESKRIVLSADRSPGKIEGLEARVRSRLQSGLVIELHPADYELRLGILQQKAAYLKETHPQLRFEKGVLEFLAHRIISNVRILEGALNRLVAAQSFIATDISMEYALHVLADLLRESDRKAQVDDIIRCVAQHYHLNTSDLLGSRRSQDIVRPRQVAIYLAKHLTTRSLPVIGRAFSRDHTTVLHSIRRIERLLVSDDELADDIDILRRRITEIA